MGVLLGAVTELERPRSGHMISAIVIHLNETTPVQVSTSWLNEMAIFRRDPTTDQRLGFWTNEVKAIHDHYR